jgi:hypothetical protein
MAVIEDALPKDVADYMLQNFVNEEFKRMDQYDLYQAMGRIRRGDKIFDDFWRLNSDNETMLPEIHKRLNMSDISGRLDQISFNRHDGDPNLSVARDWHTDLPGKKFQLIYYLGKSSDKVTFEMTDNPEHGSKRSFNFQHNRLIIFENHPKAFHKFYYTKEDRCSIVLTVHHRR